MESRKSRRNISREDLNKDLKKNKKWKVIVIFSLICTIFIYYQVFVLFKYTTGGNVTERQMSLYKWVVRLVSKEETAMLEDSKMEIAVAGNILLPNNLIENCNQNSYTYNDVFKNISIDDYDFSIANLNTQVLDKTASGEGYPSEELAKELNKIGFDIMNVATGELAQSSLENLEQTLENIEKYDMKYVGSNNWGDRQTYEILEKNSIKIAILSYIDDKYVSSSVDKQFNVYSKKQLEKDIKKLKKEKVDGIVVLFDTLRSNEREPKEEKEELLKEILNEDVDVVISNDSIIQKTYKSTNKKYIVYSLGDFIGKQEEENSDVSKLLKINVEKNKGATSINVLEEKTFVALSNADYSKYKIVDMEKEIEEYDEDKTSSITTAEYYYIKKIKENITKK